ncbi:MAG: hypothetical protein ABSH48_14320 [Verrucomicrobiota bacterium]
MKSACLCKALLVAGLLAEPMLAFNAKATRTSTISGRQPTS